MLYTPPPDESTPTVVAETLMYSIRVVGNCYTPTFSSMLDQISQLKQSAKFAELPTWLQEKIEQLLQDLVLGGFGNWQPDHCVDFVTSLLLEDFNIQD